MKRFNKLSLKFGFLFFVLDFVFLPLKVLGDDTVSPKNDIFSIEAKGFEELREPLSKRPRPPTLDFDEKAVEKYIESLAENLRTGEKERFNIIKGTKDQIYRLFERNTMEIKDSLKLRSGRSISGTIVLANQNGFIVRKSSRKGKSYKWDELGIDGYSQIIDYFAQKRLKVKVANVSDEETKKYAANDYILLTLLCDWYGEYEDAIKYANKVAVIRPEIKDKLNELLFK